MKDEKVTLNSIQRRMDLPILHLSATDDDYVTIRGWEAKRRDGNKRKRKK